MSTNGIKQKNHFVIFKIRIYFVKLIFKFYYINFLIILKIKIKIYENKNNEKTIRLIFYVFLNIFCYLSILTLNIFIYFSNIDNKIIDN